REIASPRGFLDQGLRSGENVSDIGWISDPAGLEFEIAELTRRYHKPMLVTENGIADSTDLKRQLYLFQHLLAIRRARQAGYDVRGYFHWTLADDYEWMLGYKPKFGLYEADRVSRQLVAKPSADLYRYFIASQFMSAN